MVGVEELIITASQKAKDGDAETSLSLSFLPLITSGTSANGMVPQTFIGNFQTIQIDSEC